MTLPVRKRGEDPVSLRTKVLTAGAGALIPMVANLWVVDATLLFKNFTLLAFAGTMTKAVFLFAVGCFLGYLHKAETKLLNLFAVGLSVPSLLVGLQNGSQYARLSNENPMNISQPSAKASFFTLPIVYAASAGDRPKVFSLPEESATAQFMRGLGITGSYRGYFVIAGAYPTQAEAQKALECVRKHKLTGAIYGPPSSSDEVYSVVIGEQRTSREASDLQKAATRAGIRHAFTWRLGSNAPIMPMPVDGCLR